MTPSEREAARQRAALIRREKQTQRELLAVYGQAFRDLQSEIAEAQRLVSEAQRLHMSSARWLAREQRLETVLTGMRIGLARYLTHAAPRIIDLQSSHAQQAITDAYELIQAGVGPNPSAAVEFRPPDPSVVVRLIGNAADGTPLGDLLQESAGAAVKQARHVLLRGVARGENLRTVARQLRRVAQIPAVRSLAIARTESLRAYREVSSATYANNTAVVTGWYWQSAGDMRTCPACWGMTGTFHPVEETLASHVNCRCAMVPATKSWVDMGFEGIPSPAGPVVTPGEQRFAALSTREQRQILGPAKHAAYASGDASLRDMAAPTHSPRWGQGIRTARARDLTHA